MESRIEEKEFMAVYEAFLFERITVFTRYYQNWLR